MPVKCQKHILWFLLVGLLLTACSVTRHIPEDREVVSRVRVVVDGQTSSQTALLQSVRERPYHRTFGFLPVAAWMWHSDTTTVWHRWRNKIGTAPTLDSQQGRARTSRQMERVMDQQGYTQAQVSSSVESRGRKARVTYHIRRGIPRRIASVDWEIQDERLRPIIEEDQKRAQQALRKGALIDRQMLDAERSRLTSLMRNHGYWDFNKEDVRFVADTIADVRDADLTVIVGGQHPVYEIGEVRFLGNDGQPQDVIRPKVVEENCYIVAGERYKEQNVLDTYKAMSRLHVLKYVNIRFEPRDSVPVLDAVITMMPNTPNSLQFEVDGTNTSGDLGFAASVTYRHRNIFHGSEAYTATVKGGYESLSGNLSDLVNDSYQEYSFQNTFDFPKFLAPFVSQEQRRKWRASTAVSAGFSYQRRPEYTRTIVQAGYSYKWTTQQRRQTRHTLDVIDLSYVNLPKRSESFLKIIQKAGPISYSSYSSHLIMAAAYNVYMGNATTSMMNSRPSAPRDFWALRLNPEVAGNVLYGLASTTGFRQKDAQYQVFGLPFEQYVRMDADWSYNQYLTDRSRLAYHLAGGVAVPYGNSDVMPFEKRYYSGGANSVRGWSVRTLGPGRYRSDNASLDYFNQCGDVRLDASVELRSKLFWKFEFAAFLDAGNVWTLRSYDSQPGGAFSNNFYREIAAAWGLGLRLVTDFVILRLDLGVKAYDPTLERRSDRCVVGDPLSAVNRTIHFAVGYPF